MATSLFCGNYITSLFKDWMSSNTLSCFDCPSFKVHPLISIKLSCDSVGPINHGAIIQPRKILGPLEKASHPKLASCLIARADTTYWYGRPPNHHLRSVKMATNITFHAGEKSFRLWIPLES